MYVLSRKFLKKVEYLGLHPRCEERTLYAQQQKEAPFLTIADWKGWAAMYHATQQSCALAVGDVCIKLKGWLPQILYLRSL